MQEKEFYDYRYGYELVSLQWRMAYKFLKTLAVGLRYASVTLREILKGNEVNIPTRSIHIHVYHQVL